MALFQPDDALSALSEYERERVMRMRRNRAVMAALGLGDRDIVAAAKQRCGDNGNGDATTEHARTKIVRAPKRRASSEHHHADFPIARRSSRLANHDATSPRDRLCEDDALGHRARERVDAANDHLHALEEAHHRLRHAGSQATATIVGTASYQHTLMRVRCVAHHDPTDPTPPPLCFFYIFVHHAIVVTRVLR